MNELINRILDLTRQQKIGILAGLVIALLALDYSFLYAPRSAENSSLASEVANKEDERAKKKKLVANLPRLQQQVRELDGMLKEAMAQLPDRKEIPDLLTNISNKARESGLDILVFRPRGENPHEFYAEIPVDIVVRGGFHNLVTFFDEVGKLKRLVNIQNIEIKNPQPRDEQVFMETSTLATTYRFLDEAERRKIAETRAAKGGRR